MVLFKYRPGIKYLPRTLIYYFKFIVFEPFRLLEAILFEYKIRNYQWKEDPIFILGYYRSGTTHLQETLMRDPRIGYMNFYQTYFCAGFLVTERIFKKTFGIIMDAQNFHHPAHRIPFKFDMPGEEDVCLVASGFRYAPNWGQVFPRAFRSFFEKFVFFKTCTDDEKQAFEFELTRLHKRVAMTSANRNKRMLFKSPPHTARLSMLHRLYPNAKFIFIQRNPYEILKSNQRLWKSFNDQCLHDDPEGNVDEKILWSMNECYEHYEHDKKSLNQDQLIELSYEEFMADPLKTMEKIYSQLELCDFNEVKDHFSRFLKEKHGTNIDQHHYTDHDIKLVEKMSQKWIDQGNYKAPR